MTKQKHKKSISRQTRLLLLILLPIFVLYMTAAAVSTLYFRRQIVSYTKSFADLYIKKIDQTVANINARMSLLVLGENERGERLDSYIRGIKSLDNLAYRNYYITRLRDLFMLYAFEYGTDYHFFAYYPEQKIYIGTNYSPNLPQNSWKNYRDDICAKLNEKIISPNSGTEYWQRSNNNKGEDYIFKLYFVDGFYVGSWIRTEDLIRPLEKAISGRSNKVILFSDNKQFKGTADEGSILPGAFTINRQFRKMPFRIEMKISDFGLFQKTFLMHMSLALLGFGMLATILLLVFFLYRRLMKPLKNLAEGMERMKAGQTAGLTDSSKDPAELQALRNEFTELIFEVNSLQKQVYEAELRKKMMYLEYLQIQIEPHFYLNCLNFIYNMIDLGAFDQAAEMARMTANYMRYLFNNSRDLVFIWEELDHIENYLNIQKLRFAENFAFYIEQEPEAQAVRIPPLLIQTFTENAIKYGMELNEPFRLTITVYTEQMEGEDYVNICVVDNGPGFSPEMLERLQRQEDYIEEEGQKIGISNALKRLRFAYGDRAVVNFSNGPIHGAVVDIHLPTEVPQLHSAVTDKV